MFNISALMPVFNGEKYVKETIDSVLNQTYSDFDIRLTRNMVEVFYHNNRVCCHKRLYGRVGQYSTIEGHMPEEHQQYIQWNGQRFIQWAEKIGVLIPWLQLNLSLTPIRLNSKATKPVWDY